MSDLQLSLLVIGVVVVGVVYLYNWWQERSLRRRLQDAFGEDRDDALMTAQAPAETRAETHTRIEPQLQPAYAGVDDGDSEAITIPLDEAMRAASVEQSVAAEVPDVPWFDEALDYVAEIRTPAPIGAAAVADLLSKIAAAGRPCRAAGYSEDIGAWQELGRTGGGKHSRLRLALQLVSRAGTIAAPQLAAFMDAVRGCAARLGGTAEYPDMHAALARARELDGFCADVDVAIGINVVATPGTSFSGADIRSHAEASGLKLEPDGVFHYRDAERHTLFTLDNHEPLPFIPEQITGLTTAGITLLLDVPRVAEGARVLDTMLETAQKLADALGGRLVDDNRVALNAAGVASIRQQLDGIASAMAAHGIPPGGERALRLFS
ncbi:MAG TPA: cell division protein ZipA C-terminal FtsZ-binding domain-containing protein [Burkholderiales bacterium]|nr:cell division protein ZipA C-terminal FtsZ-binding domain-containing protein [Burkholderiales bacterium]